MSDDVFEDLCDASCQNPDCTVFYETKEHTVIVSRTFYQGDVYDSWEYTCPVCGEAASFDRSFDQKELRR